MPSAGASCCLSVGRLARHRQQASHRHGGLRVGALLDAAAGCRRDALLLVGQIDLIARQRFLARRLRRLAAGLFPRRRGLRLPRRAPRFVRRQLARMAFPGPRLDFGARQGELLQGASKNLRASFFICQG